MGPTDQLLMGVSEIAAYRGVTRQAVHNWRVRGKIPKPHRQLAMGPIWFTDTIVRHFALEDRLKRIN